MFNSKKKWFIVCEKKKEEQNVFILQLKEVITSERGIIVIQLYHLEE